MKTVCRRRGEKGSRVRLDKWRSLFWLNFNWITSSLTSVLVLLFLSFFSNTHTYDQKWSSLSRDDYDQLWLHVMSDVVVSIFHWDSLNGNIIIFLLFSLSLRIETGRIIVSSTHSNIHRSTFSIEQILALMKYTLCVSKELRRLARLGENGRDMNSNVYIYFFWRLHRRFFGRT